MFRLEAMPPLGSSVLSAIGVRCVAQSTRVAVVGGGLAGLTAGLEALALGFNDVRVYEARTHRCGGRAKTEYRVAPEMWAEGGPEFVSAAHWLVQFYARFFGIELVPVQDGTTPFFPLMRGSPSPFVEDWVQSVNEELHPQVRRILEPLLRGINLDEPWKSEDARTLDAWGLLKYLEAHGLSEDCARVLRIHLTAEHGIPAQEVGLLGYLVRIAAHELVPGGYWQDFEKYRIQGGISRLVKEMADAMGGCLRLGEPVRSVLPDGEGAVLSFEDGRKELVDEAIVCVPPSLWGKEFCFNAPLAVPQLGVVSKLLLQVPRDFTIRWGINPFALKREGLLAQMAWDGTLGQDGLHRVLIAMCGDEAARRICKDPEDVARGQLMEELVELMPELNINAPQALKDWGRRRYTRAGYYCPRAGDVTQRWHLFGQTGVPQIQIAGEPFDYGFWGLMNGAMATGIDAVRNIVERRA